MDKLKARGWLVETFKIHLDRGAVENATWPRWMKRIWITKAIVSRLSVNLKTRIWGREIRRGSRHKLVKWRNRSCVLACITLSYSLKSRFSSWKGVPRPIKRHHPVKNQVPRPNEGIGQRGRPVNMLKLRRRWWRRAWRNAVQECFIEDGLMLSVLELIVRATLGCGKQKSVGFVFYFFLLLLLKHFSDIIPTYVSSAISPTVRVYNL